jgi:alcohol dehydrogenase
LATLEFVRLTGAEVTVMDMVPGRLEFCRRVYGVPHTIVATGTEADLQQVLAESGGDKYSLVIDATGNNRSMSTALQYVAHSGSLVYVGITTQEVSFPHPVLHRPEITLMGSRNAHLADFTRIINLIEDGTISTAPWITHRTTFDRMIDEFAAFTKPETGVIKAVIQIV